MKNKGLLFAILGIATLGVGYLVYKKFKADAEEKASKIKEQGAAAPTETPTDNSTGPKLLPINTGDILNDISSSISNVLSGYHNYTINTKTSDLLLRETPSPTGKVVGRFTKGSTIRAKASGTKGWMAVSDNDKDVKGYVSFVYLKLKTK